MKIILSFLVLISLTTLASVESDSYTEHDSSSYSCTDSHRICSGDIVLFKNTIREVESVDRTGLVVLKAKSDYYQTYTKAKKISKVVPAFDGFKPGDKVFHKKTIRIVELVDNTGRVVLKPTGQYYRTFTKTNKITMLEACL